MLKVKPSIKTCYVAMLAMILMVTGCSPVNPPDPDPIVTFRLGSEVFLDQYLHLVAGKRVGLVTNQTGVTKTGESLIPIFYQHPDINLTALYAPEHGLDGTASAGAYVESYTHPEYGIPVYSLYGATRKPTTAMLDKVDILVFDIQDIGARTYTYMSTMNYCMVAAQRDDIPIIILDRPNPLGGLIVEGAVLEDRFITFVGVDNLPMAHGMTAGELARFFNRKIGASLIVIPMEGYTRDMIFQDTGLPFKQTSPNIPNLQSAFGYMATGLGEGTRVGQQDKFTWIGGTGINSQEFADRLNAAGLKGITYHPDTRGSWGGVRLEITDYHTFNPARAGMYALAIAKQLKSDFVIPKSTSTTIVMFDKVMGTDKIGQYLEMNLEPGEIISRYQPDLDRFKQERIAYLIYDLTPRKIPLILQ